MSDGSRGVVGHKYPGPAGSSAEVETKSGPAGAGGARPRAGSLGARAAEDAVAPPITERKVEMRGPALYVNPLDDEPRSELHRAALDFMRNPAIGVKEIHDEFVEIINKTAPKDRTALGIAAIRLLNEITTDLQESAEPRRSLMQKALIGAVARLLDIQPLIPEIKQCAPDLARNICNDIFNLCKLSASNTYTPQNPKNALLALAMRLSLGNIDERTKNSNIQQLTNFHEHHPAALKKGLVEAYGACHHLGTDWKSGAEILKEISSKFLKSSRARIDEFIELSKAIPKSLHPKDEQVLLASILPLVKREGTSALQLEELAKFLLLDLPPDKLKQRLDAVVPVLYDYNLVGQPSLKPHGSGAGVPTGEIFGANIKGFGAHTPKDHRNT